VRKGAALLLLSLPLAACTYTRREAERPAPLPFQTVILPYPMYGADDGFSINLNAGLKRGANRLPPPISEAITVSGTLAQSGTRGVALAWDAPGRWPAWRFYVQGSAQRFRRAPYFGIGNDVPVNDSLERLYGSRYYRYELLRTGLLGIVERRLAPHVRLHVGGQLRHYRTRALSVNSAFAQDITVGTVTDGSASGAEVRAGLLFDTRQEEATPTQGLFLETMVAQSVRGADYRRYLLSAREFIALGEWDQYVIALRQTGEFASGSLPYYIAYERLTTWYPEDGFGGPTSIRLYNTGRFLANNRSVFSADLRYKLLDAPYPTSPVRVWLLAFGDVGRLWNPGQNPDLTDLHWASGVGGRIQVSKGTLIGIDVGLNDQDGLAFAIGTSFGF
jgi:outer membrane protein assembly factor BamA